MKELSRDPGWDVLTMALMKARDAELMSYKLNLQELNRQKEWAAREGNRAELERLSGYSIPVANQFMTEMPGSPLSGKFANINPQKDRLENLLSASKSGAPSPEMISEFANAPSLAGLQQQGQQEVSAQKKWKASPYSKKELDYVEAGQAAGQTIDMMKNAMQGKSPEDKAVLYGKAVSQLSDIAAKYPGRDWRGILPPLKAFLAEGGPATQQWMVYLGKNYGGGSAVVNSMYAPSSPMFNQDAANQLSNVYPDIMPHDIVRISKVGSKEPRATPSQKEITAHGEEQVAAFEKDVKLIDNMKLSPEEKKQRIVAVARLRKVSFDWTWPWTGDISISDPQFRPGLSGPRNEDAPSTPLPAQILKGVGSAVSSPIQTIKGAKNYVGEILSPSEKNKPTPKIKLKSGKVVNW